MFLHRLLSKIGSAKKSILYILSELEPKYRSVLVLKFLEEKDYEDISDILRKPPGTIATLIHRAKKEFKRLAIEKGIAMMPMSCFCLEESPFKVEDFVRLAICKDPQMFTN